jgi:hypothetical protein
VQVSGQHITYAIDLRPAKSSHRNPVKADVSIPRVARLMALAIRFQGLVDQGKIRDYAELAHLGRVTRARITQIMKLLHLAPDLQEQILFLPHNTKLNERDLRPIVRCVDWDEQRRLFSRDPRARW